MSIRTLFRFQLSIVFIFGIYIFADNDKPEPPQLSKVAALESKLEKLFSKAGISLGGTFNSRLFYSIIDESSPALDSGKCNFEDLMSTTADLEIIGRPSSSLQGKALIRIHRDWFLTTNSRANPLYVRWVSMDGSLTDYFNYHLGSFYKKYSKLTLYTPQIDILFEPQIFSERRQYAMSEVFLNDNNRLLDGINLDFGMSLNPLIKNISVSGIFSRLRAPYNLSDENAIWVESGKEDPSSILSKDSLINNALKKKWLMSKYLGTGNLDIEILSDVEIGGTFINIFDAKGTYKISEDDEKNGLKYYLDSLAQNSSVVSFRGGIGTASFVDSARFNVKVEGEFAISNDKIGHKTDTVTRITPDPTKITGNALAIDLIASLPIGGAGKISFVCGIVKNDPDFRNELTQSPSFLKTRIMNSDIDANTYSLYSTFDALYNSTFYFVPKEPSNNFAKAPLMKNAYHNLVFMKRELGFIENDASKGGHFDPALQLVMPYGPATPNRNGFNGKINADLLNEMLSLTASFQSMSEIEVNDTTTTTKATFSDFGGGAAFRLGKLLYAGKRTLSVAGSYSHSAMKDGHHNMIFNASKISSDFINFGAEWNFWRQFSLLGGYQLITTITKPIKSDIELTTKQTQWAAGLKYKISDGGTIGFTLGGFDVANTGKNLPSGTDLSKGDFSGMQYDLYVKVDF